MILRMEDMHFEDIVGKVTRLVTSIFYVYLNVFNHAVELFYIL